MLGNEWHGPKVLGWIVQVSSFWRGGNSGKEGGNPYMTERNAERLADALCRMRGAALKLGQMLSIQDENVLPPQVLLAFTSIPLWWRKPDY